MKHEKRTKLFLTHKIIDHPENPRLVELEGYEVDSSRYKDVKHLSGNVYYLPMTDMFFIGQQKTLVFTTYISPGDVEGTTSKAKYQPEDYKFVKHVHGNVYVAYDDVFSETNHYLGEYQ